VNDVYQGRTAETVERELQAMYDAARAARLPLVAGTIIPYNTATDDQNRRMHAINRWIQHYTEHHGGVAFCDTRTAVAEPGQLDRLVSSPDGLHPSPEGYRLMALALEPVIKKLAAQGR
jgi:lysophospholipase L1-like esterase